MKKILVSLYLVLCSAAFLPATPVSPSQGLIALGIHQLNQCLSQGYELQYDNVQSEESNEIFEVTFTNPRILNPSDLSVKWVHDGLLTIGRNAAENQYWLSLRGKTRVSCGEQEITITNPVRISIQTEDNILSSVFCAGSLPPQQIINAFKQFDIKLGKGKVEMGKTEPMTLVDWEEIHVVFRHDRSDKTNIKVMANSEVKGLSFPGISQEKLKQTLGSSFDGPIFELSELGEISFTIKSALTLPSVNELSTLAAKNDLVETLNAACRSKCGLEIEVSEYSDRLSHGDSRFGVRASPEDKGPRVQLLFDDRQTFTAQFKEVLAKHIINHAKSISQANLRGKENEVKKLIPHFEAWGETRRTLNFNLYCDKKGEIPNKIDFLIAFSTENGGHDCRVDGLISGLEDLITTQNHRSVQGKINISIKRYKEAVDKVCSSFNQARELFAPESIPVISSEQREGAKRHLRYLSNNPEVDDEDLEITFDFTENRDPKIGTRSMNEAIIGPQ